MSEKEVEVGWPIGFVSFLPMQKLTKTKFRLSNPQNHCFAKCERVAWPSESPWEREYREQPGQRTEHSLRPPRDPATDSAPRIAEALEPLGR